MERPPKVKDAMKYLDDYECYSHYVDAWHTIYCYIEDLENMVDSYYKSEFDKYVDVRDIE